MQLCLCEKKPFTCIPTSADDHIYDSVYVLYVKCNMIESQFSLIVLRSVCHLPARV